MPISNARNLEYRSIGLVSSALESALKANTVEWEADLMGNDHAFEYGKKVEQAGPRTRDVYARYGLEVGDGTVLNGSPGAIAKRGDNEASKARLAQGGFIAEGADGKRHVTTAGNQLLNLLSAAGGVDSARDMVIP